MSRRPAFRERDKRRTGRPSRLRRTRKRTVIDLGVEIVIVVVIIVNNSSSNNSTTSSSSSSSSNNMVWVEIRAGRCDGGGLSRRRALLSPLASSPFEIGRLLCAQCLVFRPGLRAAAEVPRRGVRRPGHAGNAMAKASSKAKAVAGATFAPACPFAGHWAMAQPPASVQLAATQRLEIGMSVVAVWGVFSPPAARKSSSSLHLPQGKHTKLS